MKFLMEDWWRQELSLSSAAWLSLKDPWVLRHRVAPVLLLSESKSFKMYKTVFILSRFFPFFVGESNVSRIYSTVFKTLSSLHILAY